MIKTHNKIGDTMELLAVLLRTVFFYFFILIIFRLMGKREFKQLSVQDLVVSILIAELVAISIENTDDSMLLTVIPISILVILEIVISFITLKSNKLRHIIEGKPTLLINKGKINYKELVKQRYSLDDLLLELRSNNIKNLKDVEYAVLENNGNLSIFKYNFLVPSSTFPFPIILDGIIQKDTLKYLKKSETWLHNILIKKNVDQKDVFYGFYKNKELYIIKKNEL